ncbi:MAG: hypothetical protein GXP08_14010 [Gammaproteobacteria bacterium]|nr:hypothetical protein [Gammaproteobacteria bacterium]
MPPRFLPDIKQATNKHDIMCLLKQEIDALRGKKDELRLALLFAVYQPTIDQVRALQQPNASRNDLPILTGKKTQHCVQAENCPPQQDSQAFSQQDLQLIREHEKKTHKLINKAFIQKFGDMFFMENFIMYHHLSRIGSKVFHIPPGNELRQLFEVFSRTGVALRGKSIPIGERLRILNLPELQSIADKLALDRVFNTIDQAISVLAKLPQIPVHLARRYHSENLFLLTQAQESWNISEVEQEWAAYNAYAKLLCANMDKGETPKAANCYDAMEPQTSPP